jgi:predicted NUDIX family NTP pyrophosphohydrolase
LKKSAGILLYRHSGDHYEVHLAHPGGPFWARKDVGAWTIPKGEFTDERPLEAAIREFHEETGIALQGDFVELTPIKQKGGKVVFAWACEGDCDVTTVVSNTFSMEWPKNSGTIRTFSEIDHVAWFSLPEAHEKILNSQSPLLLELEKILNFGKV